MDITIILAVSVLVLSVAVFVVLIWAFAGLKPELSKYKHQFSVIDSNYDKLQERYDERAKTCDAFSDFVSGLDEQLVEEKLKNLKFEIGEWKVKGQSCSGKVALAKMLAYRLEKAKEQGRLKVKGGVVHEIDE